MSEYKTPIPAMLYNAAVGGHVTNSQQIIDENENKEQSQINAEVKQTLGQGGSVDSRIATAVNIEKTRAEAAEQLLQEQYDALTQSDIIVGDLPESGTKNLIYRVPGTNSYSDYMWNGTQFVKMAEYDNAIDDEPTVGSDNLVKSGGVAINMGVLEIENTSGEDKAILLSIFAGKKVLLYTNVAGQGILDDWTSTDRLVFGIYYLIDFTNISTPRLYNKQNIGGKLYFSTNSSDIEKFVNSKKIYKIYPKSESGDGMFVFKNKKEIILFENKNYAVTFFPNKSDNLISKNAIPFNVNDVFYLENKLHQWSGTEFVEIADEDNINSIINPQFPTTTYGYLDENGVAQNIGQSSTGCFVYTEYITVKQGDKITYHGGYYDSNSLNPIWGYDVDKQNAVPLGKPFIGKEQEYSIIINSDTIKYIRYFGKITYKPLVKVCRVPNDNKNPYDIIVAADGSGDYTSLYDAIVNNVGLHKSIFIKAGLYEMPVQTNSSTLVNNRDLTIVGEAKERVIIYNNNGVYTSFNNDATPIRMSGKVSLRNLTIISKSTDYVGDGVPAAYCVHVDFDAADGDIMEIDNCRMYNDHYACIGVGLRAGFTLKIRNCELYSHSDESFDQQLWNGAIICHDGSAAGNAPKIEMVNNIIECTGKYALSLRTAFDNPFSALFIGNAIFSNNENPINKNSLVILDAKSCNNNIDVQTHYD